jgi:signal transduction histidine kinase
MGPSLDFLLSHGDTIFPGAPIVFCGIDRRELGDRVLTPHVRGILVKREFVPTLDLALRLHPETRRIAVVAGTSEFDTRLLEAARREFRAYEDRLAFTYMTALPLPKLLTELSRLPPQTVVLYTTLFRDGAGQPFVPHDTVENVSAAANAPVYGFLDQYLGHGIVGGNLYSLAAHGPEAARLGLRILAGTEPPGPSLSEVSTSTVMFDWRQLQRWGISESWLPPGSRIQFRPTGAWEQYRWQIVLVTVALLGQSLLIAGLLYHRRRRQLAEVESRQRAAELAHVNRRAVAGEITASIAHELNQPLTAILSNAEAAHDLLGRKDHDPETIREIVADIIDQDTRAADVIDRIRRLLRKGGSRSEPIDLNRLVDSSLRLLHGEIVRRKASVETALTANLPVISGDPVQLQQVLLNLLINAMDAIAAKAPDRRMIRVSTRANGKHVEVHVVDFGHGIAAGLERRVFEPFFTTKQNGLGLGLSICSTIANAHGGALAIANNEHGGATAVLSLSTRAAAAPA